MYTTQPHFWGQGRKAPNKSLLHKSELHRIPQALRKSLRVPKQRPKPYHRKRNNQYLHISDQQSISITICNPLEPNPQKSMGQNFPSRNSEQFETTADRMMSIRRRLSPLKGPRETSPQKPESAGQHTSFLNIEKLRLIKLYSQAQKGLESTHQEGLQDRYLRSVSQKHKQNEQIFQNQVMEMRRTIKESSFRLRERVSMFTNRSRPFQVPFDRYHYRDFIWKVAFSNSLTCKCLPQETKLKVFVGRGNNSLLVRSLMARRSWWSFTERYQEANFVWTQLKIQHYYSLQTAYEEEHEYRPSVEREGLNEAVRNRNGLNLKIMSQQDVLKWDTYWQNHKKDEQKIGQDLKRRIVLLKKENMARPSSQVRIHNHLPHNYLLGNKKALYYTMRQHYQAKGQDVFDYLPLTFHLNKGLQDEEYTLFLKRYYSKRKRGGGTMWIVKPGELTNRGNGIVVCLHIDEIKNIIKRGGKHWDGSVKTFIIQEYIERPFLYQGRKFDIRHFILVTSVNGRRKGYWYNRGYIRTTSSEYTLNHGQAAVHLTNDAVQKQLPDYGRFEKGNKLSYEDFQEYLKQEYQNRYDFWDSVYPQMQSIAMEAMQAASCSMDPHKLQHNFQLFGLDFLIDANFRPWLIEVNSNPCLQISCPLLADMIPALIENTIRIGVDSLTPPPVNFKEKRNRFGDHALSGNQFQLVYDSEWEGAEEYAGKGLDHAKLAEQEDQTFEDDGQALED